MLARRWDASSISRVHHLRQAVRERKEEGRSRIYRSRQAFMIWSRRGLVRYEMTVR
jgi:hypothetical protein